MARHNETGKEGELLARLFLVEAGWQILETNWRLGRTEIDIIGREGDVLVFVEVKTRVSSRHGMPEEAVSPGKMKRMALAAGRYMELCGHEWEIRFDVVSVLLQQGQEPQVTHLRDAFFPGL